MFNLGIFNRKSIAKKTVGVEMRDHGFSVSVVNLAEPLAIEHANFKSYEQVSKDSHIELFANELEPFLSASDISNLDCHLVLNQSDYQLLLVEDPDVPDAERYEAVRWRIKDLSNVPVEFSSLAIFELPSSQNRNVKKMLYVVVTDKRKLKKIVKAIQDCSLNLISIDINELALRDLSVLSQEDIILNRGVAILRLTQNQGQISVFNQSELYLSRCFKVNYNAGLLDDLPGDAIALEVQRSLDYYERQMGQVQPGMLLVCGDNVTEDKITESFKASLAINVAWFNLQDYFDYQEGVDDGMCQLCVASLGASVRNYSANVFISRKAS